MKNLLILLLSLIPLIGHTQTISTICGNGGAGNTGDGAAATSATATPGYLAIDRSRNIYFATGNIGNSIRKINPSGIISTVAGSATGTGGFGGDGNAATGALLAFPMGIAVDTNGNIYVCDFWNNRVRKITVATGTITTIAGTGTAGFSGDGLSATSARLWNPFGICLDNSGNIFINDGGNNRIRKINPSGIITTIAGNGVAGYTGDGVTADTTEINAGNLCADGSGNIYFADPHDYRVRKISASGIITTVAGTGVCCGW